MTLNKQKGNLLLKQQSHEYLLKTWGNKQSIFTLIIIITYRSIFLPLLFAINNPKSKREFETTLLGYIKTF